MALKRRLPKLGGGCCCSSSGVCTVTICVKGCGGADLPGASVTIKTGGGVIVATGTTNGIGCVSLNVLAAGTYTVLITRTGFANFSTSQAITCGSTYTYTLSNATGYSCFGSCGCPDALPNTVTINDGFGDVTCTTGTIFGTWAGCAMRPITAWFLDNACSHSTVDYPKQESVDIPIWFGVSCTVGGISVAVYVVECVSVFGGFASFWMQEGCNCSNPTGDFAENLDCSGLGSSSSSTFSCDPFGGTFTLTCPGPGSTSGNPPKMFDVYGGTASFTLTP